MSFANLRTDLPAVPRRMTRLPIDKRGYPVPWFVAWIDGEPDFRIIKPRAVLQALRDKKCWICGERLGKYKAFVIGPMCAINRVSSEPPMHRDCAEFAAMACPFLTRPTAKRREHGLAELDVKQAAGNGLKRNPGVALVWITKRFEIIRLKDGLLFDVGKPDEVLWFCEGREATRDEVMESIRSGYPILQEAAEKEGDGAVEELVRRRSAAERLLPVV